MAVKNKYYLWLNSASSQDLSLLAVGQKGERLSRRRVHDGSRSERLLGAVATFVSSRKTAPHGIGVAVAEESSFSQNRRVCVAANALGYAWGVPVCNADSGTELVRRMARAPKRSLAAARYHGPAVG